MFNIEKRNTFFISCQIRLSSSWYLSKEVPERLVFYYFEKETKFPVPPSLLKGLKAYFLIKVWYETTS